MARPGIQKVKWLLATNVSIVYILAAVSFLGAHTGHKHPETQVTLPEVVAQVNGEDIKKDVIMKGLENAVRKYKAKGMALSVDQEKTAAKKLIENEIERTLLLQKGKEAKISVTQEMVEKKLDEVAAKFESRAVFGHTLASRGMNIDQYKEELKTDLLLDQVIQKEIEPGIKISPEEAKAYYEKNKGEFGSPEKVRASVILIKVDKKKGVDHEAAARKKIDSILTRLQNGADFKQMAQLNSQDSLASKGGDLGFFTKKQMLSAFSNRAFKMKAGEVSEIFATKHGYQLLKVTDRKPAETKPFEKVEGQIVETLKKQKVGQATREYVQALRKKAEVKTYF